MCFNINQYSCLHRLCRGLYSTRTSGDPKLIFRFQVYFFYQLSYVNKDKPVRSFRQSTQVCRHAHMAYYSHCDICIYKQICYRHYEWTAAVGLLIFCFSYVANVDKELGKSWGSTVGQTKLYTAVHVWSHSNCQCCFLSIIGAIFF